jgi:hypothetical protein
MYMCPFPLYPATVTFTPNNKNTVTRTTRQKSKQGSHSPKNDLPEWSKVQTDEQNKKRKMKAQTRAF